MAVRFGRSTGGNWNGAATWSTTSGGTNDVPGGLAAGDDVVLDSNSSGTFNINAAISLSSIDCSGLTTGASGSPFAGTLSHVSGVTQVISGTDASVATGSKPLRLVSAMTFSAGSTTAIFQFSATAAGNVTIDTASKSIGGMTTGSTGASSSTFVHASDIVGITGCPLIHTSGVWSPGSINISVGQFASSNSNTRTVNMGSGTWTLSVGRNANVWDYTNVSGLTHNKDTASLVFSGSVTGQRSLQFGGKTFYSVTFADLTASPFGSTTLLGTAPTFDTLNITAPLKLTLGAGFTVTNAPTLSGSSATSPLMLVASQTTDLTRPAITCTAGTFSLAYAMIQGINFTGGATFTATNSFGFGNTGITITGPTGGGAGGFLNW